MSGHGGMIADVSALEAAMEPSLLERRYRALLRVLPRAYRQRWSDDMVDTYVDMAAESAPDTDWTLGRPTAGDVVDVLGLAVRLRVGAVRGRLDPAAAGRSGWGAAVRAVVAAALLVHAVLGLLAVGGALWMAGQIAWLPAVPAQWQAWEGAALPTGTWPVLAFVAPLAWTVAFVALACGRVRTARWWTAAALVPFGADAWRAASIGLPWTASQWVLLALWLLPLAGLVAFHDGAPSLRRDPWLGALLAGVIFVHAVLLLTPHQVVFLDDIGLVCIAAGAVALLHLVRLAAGRADAARTGAVALLVAYAFVLRSASYGLELRELGNFGVLRTAMYTEIAVTFVLAALLGLLAARARRAPLG